MTSLGESEGARRARHFCALERRLFEVLGGWVSSVAEPEAKLLLRVHSFRHAWHAELWAGLLPAGEDESSAELRPGVAGILGRVAEPTVTLERLAGVYRGLLPQLEATYVRIREGLAEASGGPEGRVLDLILNDDRQAHQAGEALLEGLHEARDEGSEVLAGAAAAVEHVVGAIRAARGLDATEMA